MDLNKLNDLLRKLMNEGYKLIITSNENWKIFSRQLNSFSNTPHKDRWSPVSNITSITINLRNGDHTFGCDKSEKFIHDWELLEMLNLSLLVNKLNDLQANISLLLHKRN